MCRCFTCPCTNGTHNAGGLCTKCVKAGHEPDAEARLSQRVHYERTEVRHDERHRRLDN